MFVYYSIIIGGLYIWIDELTSVPLDSKHPSLAIVFGGIVYFILQYWLSGYACAHNWPLQQVHAVLIATMMGSFALFDRSPTVLAVGAATGLGGPLIELFLINQLHLYCYTQADFFGIDSWIPWVYAAGTPAVGNLARAYRVFFSTPRGKS